MNMSKKFDKRKKVVYDLICDDLYTPMKFKELAMLLRVAKEDRDELRQILESLEQEGKIYLSKLVLLAACLNNCVHFSTILYIGLAMCRWNESLKTHNMRLIYYTTKKTFCQQFSRYFLSILSISNVILYSASLESIFHKS